MGLAPQRGLLETHRKQECGVKFKSQFPNYGLQSNNPHAHNWIVLYEFVLSLFWHEWVRARNVFREIWKWQSLLYFLEAKTSL